MGIYDGGGALRGSAGWLIHPGTVAALAVVAALVFRRWLARPGRE